jgi:phosphoribosylformylglycinamidine synthase|tara:strand:- start:3270 stop:3548 length:279 start_codon:yes stop_codon:yes gene_type:complete
LKDGVLVARVIVDVMLKPEILDPQGRAVQGALGRLRLSGVTDVRQGKQFIIELEGDLDDARRATLEELAGELLSNPVIEDYTMTVVDDEAGA